MYLNRHGCKHLKIPNVQFDWHPLSMDPAPLTQLRTQNTKLVFHGRVRRGVCRQRNCVVSYGVLKTVISTILKVTKHSLLYQIVSLLNFHAGPPMTQNAKRKHIFCFFGICVLRRKFCVVFVFCVWSSWSTKTFCVWSSWSTRSFCVGPLWGNCVQNP